VFSVNPCLFYFSVICSHSLGVVSYVNATVLKDDDKDNILTSTENIEN